MKASIQISTGLLIGSWEPSDDAVMLQDAANRGIPANDVELREITHGELITLIDARDAVSLTYDIKRANAYPKIQEYADAQVKLSSSDPLIQAQGQVQLNQYINDCLAVKLKYPKPV